MLISLEPSLVAVTNENVPVNVDKTRDSRGVVGKKAVGTAHGVDDTQVASGNSTVAAIQKLIRLLPGKYVLYRLWSIYVL